MKILLDFINHNTITESRIDIDELIAAVSSAFDVMSGMFQFSNFNSSFLPICKINPQCNTEYMFLKCGKKNALKYIDPSVDSII